MFDAAVTKSQIRIGAWTSQQSSSLIGAIKDLPSNLLVLSFSWLDNETSVIHLMHVSGRLHILQNVLLQLWHCVKRVWHILILLNIPNDLGSLGSFGKVDKVGLFDD